jgi:Dolichyl-phosphate-mannose-protein mannosyltransferase
MTKRIIPYVLAAMALIAGVASLHQYNVTWDEALGDLFFGQRYFSFFTSLDRRYLDFRADPYPPNFRPDLSSSPFRLRPWEHYPVASTLATATSRLLAPLLDPFDGYHAFNLLIGAAFLILFYRFMESEWGALAATTSALLLFLAPRIAGDAMANVKDFSEMIFFSATAILFYFAVERRSVALLLFSGVIWGFALGTKANALFLPPILLLYCVGAGFSRHRPARALIVALLAWGAIGAVVFFVSWPYLWQAPGLTLRSNLIYLLARKSGTRPESMAGPFPMILFTTPLPLLFAFVAGVVPLFRKIRHPQAMLLISWIGVVCARLLLPAAVNFDGVRHFLELFPAMAAVGGIGVAWATTRLRPALRAAIAAVILVSMVVSLVRIHPFQTAYWNVFAGGLSGAMARQIPQAGDYWAASYRIGLRWLDEHAEHDALLAVPIAEHAVRIVAPYRLRPDIRLVHITNAWSPRVDPRLLAMLHQVSTQKPVYVMFVLRRDWSNALMIESLAHFQPLAVWRVDGAPVLVIFRMTRSRSTR